MPLEICSSAIPSFPNRRIPLRLTSAAFSRSYSKLDPITAQVLAWAGTGGAYADLLYKRPRRAGGRAEVGRPTAVVVHSPFTELYSSYRAAAAALSEPAPQPDAAAAQQQQLLAAQGGGGGGGAPRSGRENARASQQPQPEPSGGGAPLGSPTKGSRRAQGAGRDWAHTEFVWWDFFTAALPLGAAASGVGDAALPTGAPAAAQRTARRAVVVLEPWRRPPVAQLAARGAWGATSQAETQPQRGAGAAAAAPPEPEDSEEESVAAARRGGPPPVQFALTPDGERLLFRELLDSAAEPWGQWFGFGFGSGAAQASGAGAGGFSAAREVLRAAQEESARVGALMGSPAAPQAPDGDAAPSGGAAAAAPSSGGGGVAFLLALLRDWLADGARRALLRRGARAGWQGPAACALAAFLCELGRFEDAQAVLLLALKAYESDPQMGRDAAHVREVAAYAAGVQQASSGGGAAAARAARAAAAAGGVLGPVTPDTVQSLIFKVRQKGHSRLPPQMRRCFTSAISKGPPGCVSIASFGFSSSTGAAGGRPGGGALRGWRRALRRLGRARAARLRPGQPRALLAARGGRRPAGRGAGGVPPAQPQLRPNRRAPCVLLRHSSRDAPHAADRFTRGARRLRPHAAAAPG